MKPANLTQLQNKLHSSHPAQLFRLCSNLGTSNIVTGPDEIVVTFGISSLIEITNGSRSLDPTNVHYDSDLTDLLRNAHLVIGTIPFNPNQEFTLAIPTAAFIFQRGGGAAVSLNSDYSSQTTKLFAEIQNSSSYLLQDELTSPPQLNVNFSTLETDHSFEARVSQAIEAIRSSSLNKVVLSKAAQLVTQSELTNLHLYLQMSKYTLGSFDYYNGT